jgi:hypothetical protein
VQQFAEIPVVDNHLHPPLSREAAAARPFTAFFTEAGDPDVLARHVPETRFFKRAVRDLAALLDCAPSAEAVESARAALGPEAWLALCCERGNVAALVVDSGYPAVGQGMSPAEMARSGKCAAVEVLRLESLVSSLATEGDDLAGFDRALVLALDGAHARGVGALKSIAAYRCGLAFQMPEAPQAAAGLRHEHARCLSGQTRVADPRLIFHALGLALEWAGDRHVPVQIHSGFGDRDLDLTLANPALLRPLLENPRFNRGPLVLLHAGYPYTREAGYLAAMYPNVFVDWSLANPLLAGSALVRVLDDLLGLAPATKLLYGSDAWGVPDWIWLGAVYGREALATVLDGDPDAGHMARRILHDNAAELYGLTR